MDDHNGQNETREQCYDRAAREADNGYILDGQFLLDIVRTTTRLGPTNPIIWGAYHNLHYGTGLMPIKTRDQLNSLLHDFLKEAWGNGKIGREGPHLLNHQSDKFYEDSQMALRYCVQVYGQPDGTTIGDLEWVAHGGYFLAMELPFPADGKTWTTGMERYLIRCIHKADKGEKATIR